MASLNGATGGPAPRITASGLRLSVTAVGFLQVGATKFTGRPIDLDTFSATSLAERACVHVPSLRTFETIGPHEARGKPRYGIVVRNLGVRGK